MGALLALLAALSYGVGDFVGGFGGRRSNAALISIPVQVTGFLFAAVAIAGGFGGSPTASVLAWGAVSGIGSGIGNATLLRGLARGQMSVVAPLSAVITAALPALVGLLAGDRLSAWGWAGIVLALPAVALTSWSGRATGFRISDVGYGVAAGVGFGLVFVALDMAGSDAGAWPLLAGQPVALLVACAAALPEIRRLRRTREPFALAATGRWGVACGLFGSTANLLFLVAAGSDMLTVVAVLAGLYPAVTVALAAAVLGERMARSQFVGLVASAVAVVLIVGGS